MYGIKIWSSEKDNDWYLLRDKNGFKLSKSSKSTSIESYRENGFTPEQIIELIEHKENFPI